MNQKQKSKTTKQPPQKTEIRLSGSGGQGLILAGIILAEAAAIYDGVNAIQTQSYGPEARGGASKSEVIISTNEILYPKTTRLDYLLALNQESCDKYARDLKEKGLLIVDSGAVEHVPPVHSIRLPLVKTAREKVGRVMTTNIVSLGALVGISHIVSPKSLEKAVLSRVPKGTEQLNLKALKLGFEMAEEIRERFED
ncbi:MAG: 2-oxoacid:acceptor oxidoreductase family protein [Calditrichaeota bacterium]|nr:2-oxoacid:acceptor oxidoreductase family protein [Calditrichota bacterium]RQV92164.1 MAG: 2-oxoacid:ferredoxin oxidoreductase subunit gamma [bacterium]